MATYVNDLRLKEIATGDESGTWGASTNTNLELIAEAFSFGTEAITTNADTHTTTIADGSTDPGRSLFLKYTGTLDSACTITIGPNTVSKLWLIQNSTSGGFSIIIKQGSGATVTVPNGQTKAIYSDGAGSGGAMVDAFAHLNVVDLTVEDDLTITDDLTVSGAFTLTGNADLNGDLDVDGTTNLDVVDIDGAVDFASTTAHAGNATFADNAKAIFGAGSDLQIYHDGSNSYVEDTATGSLILKGADVVVKDSSNNDIAKFLDGGAAQLRYAGAVKLATTSSGIDVTGSVTADGLTSSTSIETTGSASKFVSNSSSSGDYIRLYAGSGTGKWDIYGNGANLRIGDNDSAGAVHIDTNVGIGTSSPQAKLHSYTSGTGSIPTGQFNQTSDANTALTLINANNSATYSAIKLETRETQAAGWMIANEFQSAFNGDLVFRGRDGGTSSAEVLRLKSNSNATFSGSVGIGTTATTGYSGQSNIFLGGTGNIYADSSVSADSSLSISQNAFVDADGSWEYIVTDEASNYYQHAGNHVWRYAASGTAGADISWQEAMRIDSSGRLGLGTSGPEKLLTLEDAHPTIAFNHTTSWPAANQELGIIEFRTDWNGVGAKIQGVSGAQWGNTDYPGRLTFHTTSDGSASPTERMRINSNGTIAVNSTATNRELTISAVTGGGQCDLALRASDDNNFCQLLFGDTSADNTGIVGYKNGDEYMFFQTGNAVAMRIDSSQNLLVGDSSATFNDTAKTVIRPNADNWVIKPAVCTAFNRSGSDGDVLEFYRGASSKVGSISVNSSRFTIEGPDNPVRIATGTSNIQINHDTHISFDTAGSEAMRISGGNLLVGTTDTTLFNNTSGGGINLMAANRLDVARAGDVVATFNRMTNDGSIIQFYAQGALEGSIDVSGNTVSLVGFSGAHASSGVDVTTAKGTVVSTVDQEHKNNHAKIKISDSEGDARVYGVIDRISEEGDIIVSGVGIGEVKVTGACAGGDLLESNGDGTAKVQSDDIIRSKTIGKVTIGNSDEGVKLVSCVLYCG